MLGFIYPNATIYLLVNVVILIFALILFTISVNSANY